MSSALGQTYSMGRVTDLDQGPRRVVMLFILALAAFIVAFFIWMNYARLDIAVSTQGSVVPSSKVQQIQSLEGGIIRELKVSEGQEVKQGDLLVRLENISYSSDLGEARQNYWGQLAAIARLDALASNRKPVFPAEVRKNAAEVADRELQVWHSRKNELRAMIDAASGMVEQRRQELADIRSKVTSLDYNLSIAREQLDIEQQLYDSGAGSRSDYLRAKQESSRVEGDLNSARINVSRLTAAVREAKARKAEVETRFKADVSQERSELQTSVAALKEVLSGKQDRVVRRELRAPVDGVVNRLLVSTVGGVAKAGDSIMEIVPVDDTLMIAARVDPKDIAFIKPGQTALVRVTAYDSSIYGALSGKVARVGADAVLDEKKNAYFEVYLKTDHGYDGPDGRQLKISPGMMTDASIQTGSRTLMEYLLKPIVKTFDTALSER